MENVFRELQRTFKLVFCIRNIKSLKSTVYPLYGKQEIKYWPQDIFYSFIEVRVLTMCLTM